VLRQQINVLQRTGAKEACLQQDQSIDFRRPLSTVPDVRVGLAIKPDTVIRWHRMGFRAYSRWKSRSRGGRPTVPLEVRQLIRDLSLANPLSCAPRIHGELLKLSIDVGQTSVANYMAQRRGRRPRGWKTFLLSFSDGSEAAR